MSTNLSTLWIIFIIALLQLSCVSLYCQDPASIIQNSWEEIDSLKALDDELASFEKLVELDGYLYSLFNTDIDVSEINKNLYLISAYPSKSLDLENQLDDKPKILAKYYEFLGFKNTGSNPKLAEEYLKKAVHLLDNHKLSFRLYSRLALVKGIQERINESIGYSQKGIEATNLYFTKDNKLKELFLLTGYITLATAYLNKGDIKSGRKYANLGLSTAYKIDSDYAISGAISTKLAELLRSELPNKVIDLFFENEALLNSVPENIRTHAYHTLGDAYLKAGKFEEAIAAIETSHDASMLESNRFISQQTLGESYFALNEYETAISYYDEMIEFFNRVGGNESILAQAYYLRSNCYEALGNLEQAKLDVLKAMEFDGSYENWSIDYYPFLTKIYMDYFDKTTDQTYQDSVIMAIDKTDSLINHVRISRRYFEDEFRLGQSIYNAYASNIHTYSRLLEKQPSYTDKERLYKYFENLKAYSLKELLKTDNAVDIGNIPDEILQEEKNFKTKLSILEEIIYESRSNELDSEIQDLRIELDKVKDEYYDFLNKLEKKYPGYYRLQYENESVTLKQLQQFIRSDEQIIEYFISDEYIFNLVISTDSILFQRKPIPDNWLKNVELFKDYLSSPSSTVDSFEILSQYFYKHVIKDAVETLPDEIKHLRIVPDDVLNFIPFELLIDKTSNKRDFRQLDYLQNRFTISYIASSSLLVNTFNSPKISHKQNYIGFAPSYKNVLSDSTNAMGNKRNTTKDLPFARESVTNAAELFGGSSYKGEEATVNMFINQANDASIIHLAMHGTIDLEKPAFSNLLFYGNKEDNKLYTNEVYGLELSSDLAVLSACNTGIGQIINGDGIQNMSRAFSFAGVKNTIMSLWSVPDVQTMTVNELFFKNVKEGKPLDNALRQAKLDYLGETSQLRAHPYYWAGLVANGTMEPLQFSSGFIDRQSIPLLLLTAALIIGSFVFFRRKN